MTHDARRSPYRRRRRRQVAKDHRPTMRRLFYSIGFAAQALPTGPL